MNKIEEVEPNVWEIDDGKEITRLYKPRVYREGTIVPRSLVRVKPRSQQYRITFNVDCALVGRSVYSLNPNGPMILCDMLKAKGCDIRDVNFIGVGNSSVFEVINWDK